MPSLNQSALIMACHRSPHGHGISLCIWLDDDRTRSFWHSKCCWSPLALRTISPDGWGAYERHVEAEQHTIGRAHTQKIKSKHINLRTRIKRLVRRTICFSKTERMHDLVIGLFITR
jgi:insertion element IS1 protein InsB